MFSLFRFIFWITFFIIIFIVRCLKKKNTYSLEPKRFLLFILLFIILVTFSGFIPVENAFITFSTPEQSYKYCDNSDLAYVIEGNQSAMVVSTNKDYLIIPKSENGWKIGMRANTKTKKQLIDSGFWIFLIEHDKIEDCYIMIYSAEKIINISDSIDTVFGVSEDCRFAYAYIEEYKDPYTVVINGISITV